MKRLAILFCLLLLTGCGFAQYGVFFNANYAMATAATPTFSPAAGSVSSGTTVTISSASGCGSYIYWNTTGAPVTTGNTHGTSATVTSTETIYAKVIGCPGYGDSAVGSAAYTVTSTPQYVASSFTSAGVVANGGTFTVTCSGGELVAILYQAYHSATTVSMSATNSNTVTADTSLSSDKWIWFHIANCTAGSSTVTVSVSGTSSGGTFLAYARYTGVSRLDAAGTFVQSTANPVTCSVAAAANELIIGAASDTSGTARTWSSFPSGYTGRFTGSHFYTWADGLSASGSNTFTATPNGGTTFDCQVVAYH